jgi:LPXTG-motif cell wall-anchored protein
LLSRTGPEANIILIIIGILLGMIISTVLFFINRNRSKNS